MAWQQDDDQDQGKETVQREIERRRSRGEALAPVLPQAKGSKLAQHFWGIAWQHHLEGYADYHSRLPKSRTLLRQGKVMDLAVHPGEITAIVAGQALHDVIVKIKPLAPEHWAELQAACAGKVGSLLSLLTGSLGDDVMKIIADRETGLFPARSEIKVICDCTDDSELCPHGAATLYAVGLQFDARPELFFQLRAVDAKTLVDQATQSLSDAPESPAPAIADEDLASVFDIHFAD